MHVSVKIAFANIKYKAFYGPYCCAFASSMSATRLQPVGILCFKQNTVSRRGHKVGTQRTAKYKYKFIRGLR